MISLEITKRHITLSSTEQGLATGANARSALAPEFANAIQSRTTTSNQSLTINEATLDRMIVRYSEQLVFKPLIELRHWFTYQSGAYLEPGYPPLYYRRTDRRSVSPNKSAVAAIGEGIAGFLSQRLYHCLLYTSPSPRDKRQSRMPSSA